MEWEANAVPAVPLCASGVERSRAERYSIRFDSNLIESRNEVDWTGKRSAASAIIARQNVKHQLNRRGVFLRERHTTRRDAKVETRHRRSAAQRTARNNQLYGVLYCTAYKRVDTS